METRINSIRLKEELYRRGETNKDFCKRAGIGIITLQGICNRKRTPSAPVAKKIMDALGLDFSDLFEIVKTEEKAV